MEQAVHLDCLEFFWCVDRMEQYPISLEDRWRGEELVRLLRWIRGWYGLVVICTSRQCGYGWWQKDCGIRW